MWHAMSDGLCRTGDGEIGPSNTGHSVAGMANRRQDSMTSARSVRERPMSLADPWARRQSQGASFALNWTVA